ncbi:MAG TPA: protein YgfX [Sulfuricaulis sp.]|nr:protein YgfX [Sulfuricaulis sp.]
MSQKSEINLILNIKVSHLLAGIFFIVHLGAMVLGAVIPIGWPLRVVLWSLLGWNLYYSLITHAWRSGPLAIQAIELDKEGVVSVRLTGSDTWQPARITSHYVHPWLTLMSLRLENRRWPINLIIAKDAVEPEPFRRWRVALKLQAVEV